MPQDFRNLNERRTAMTDLQKIARRILRMIAAGETNQDIFVRDSGTLAELVLSVEEITTKRFK